MRRIGELLNGVVRQERAGRVRFAPPASSVSQVTDTYAEVWFPSPGCPWDDLGHCTTCNFGAPAEVASGDMVAAVAIGLAEIQPTTEMVWVSAFDTLHPREVPPDARREIFRLLGASPARTVLTEAHPASVRADVLAECVALLGDRQLGLQLGVETMDELVRRACVNKPFGNAVVARAVATARDAGVETWANLILGIPFLEPQEAIHSTTASVHAVFEMGFDHVVLFPNHVKEHTVADRLWRAGWYEPPDAWSMRDVLAGLGDVDLDRVNLAWLDLKDHPGAPAVHGRPDPDASRELSGLLAEFNVDHSRSALAAALALPRPNAVPAASGQPLADRIEVGLAWLAEGWQQGWWEQHRSAVRAELRDPSLVRVGAVAR